MISSLTASPAAAIPTLPLLQDLPSLPLMEEVAAQKPLFKDRSLPPMCRLREYLQQKNVYDKFWKIALDVAQQVLSDLGNEERVRLHTLFSKLISIVSKDGSQRIRISLNEIFLNLLASFGLPKITTVEIIGGAVFWILGKEFVEKLFQELQLDLRDVLFEDEIEAFFVEPTDVDLRIHVAERNVVPFEWWLEDLFRRKAGTSCFGDGLNGDKFVTAHVLMDSDNWVSTLSFGDQTDFKVDIAFENLQKRKFLFLSDDVRLPIHDKENGLSLFDLITSNFMRGALIPTGENEMGRSGIIARTAKIVEVPDIATVNLKAGLRLPILATKDYFFPDANEVGELCQRLVGLLATDSQKGLQKVKEALKDHLNHSPLAVLGICLNIVSYMCSNINNPKVGQQIYQALCHKKGLMSSLSFASPGIASLAACMNEEIPTNVLFSLLVLLQDVFQQERFLESNFEMAFIHSSSQRTLYLQLEGYLAALHLHGDPHAAFITLKDYLSTRQAGKHKSLKLFEALVEKALSALPKSVLVEREALDGQEKRSQAIELALTPSGPHTHSFEHQLDFLLLYKHGSQKHLLPMLAKFAGFLAQGNYSKVCFQLAFESVKHLLCSMSGHGVSIDALQHFEIQAHEENASCPQILGEWCVLLAGAEHFALYRSAQASWKLGIDKYPAYFLNAHHLHRLLHCLASHSRQSSLQMLVLAKEHEIRGDKSSLAHFLINILEHYARQNSLREELADLPLLARASLSLLSRKRSIIPLNDLLWLSHQLSSPPSPEGAALIEMLEAIQAEPAQRQTLLEYWEQFCSAFAVIDKENVESACHRLEIMLGKIMTLDLDESTYERVTANLIQVYSTLLSEHCFTIAENFLRNVISWPTWKKQFLQRKQIATRMLLLFCQAMRAAASPNDNPIDLLQLCFACRRECPSGELAEELALQIVFMLKLIQDPNQVSDKLKECFKAGQEWLFAALNKHPNECLQLVPILKSYLPRESIAVQLKKFYFCHLGEKLATSLTESTTQEVMLLAEEFLNEISSCGCQEEVHLRIRIISCYQSKSLFAATVPHLLALMQYEDLDAFSVNSLEAPASQLLDYFLDHKRWDDAELLLSISTAHYFVFQDIHSWKKLCEGKAKQDPTGAVRLLMGNYHHFSLNGWLTELQQVAFTCVACPSNKGVALEICQNYDLVKAWSWDDEKILELSPIMIGILATSKNAKDCLKALMCLRDLLQNGYPIQELKLSLQSLIANSLAIRDCRSEKVLVESLSVCMNFYEKAYGILETFQCMKKLSKHSLFGVKKLIANLAAEIIRGYPKEKVHQRRILPEYQAVSSSINLAITANIDLIPFKVQNNLLHLPQARFFFEASTLTELKKSLIAKMLDKVSKFAKEKSLKTKMSFEDYPTPIAVAEPTYRAQALPLILGPSKVFPSIEQEIARLLKSDVPILPTTSTEKEDEILESLQSYLALWDRNDFSLDQLYLDKALDVALAFFFKHRAPHFLNQLLGRIFSLYADPAKLASSLVEAEKGIRSLAEGHMIQFLFSISHSIDQHFKGPVRLVKPKDSKKVCSQTSPKDFFVCFTILLDRLLVYGKENELSINERDTRESELIANFQGLSEEEFPELTQMFSKLFLSENSWPTSAYQCLAFYFELLYRLYPREGERLLPYLLRFSYYEIINNADFFALHCKLVMRLLEISMPTQYSRKIWQRIYEIRSTVSYEPPKFKQIAASPVHSPSLQSSQLSSAEAIQFFGTCVPRNLSGKQQRDFNSLNIQLVKTRENSMASKYKTLQQNSQAAFADKLSHQIASHVPAAQQQEILVTTYEKMIVLYQPVRLMYALLFIEANLKIWLKDKKFIHIMGLIFEAIPKSLPYVLLSENMTLLQYLTNFVSNVLRSSNDYTGINSFMAFSYYQALGQVAKKLNFVWKYEDFTNLYNGLSAFVQKGYFAKKLSDLIWMLAELVNYSHMALQDENCQVEILMDNVVQIFSAAHKRYKVLPNCQSFLMALTEHFHNWLLLMTEKEMTVAHAGGVFQKALEANLYLKAEEKQQQMAERLALP